ncbi:YrdB family protein [Streptomyces sp. NPDC051014]|uniref:YrdB family protein n=1 Tax=Streptomyces sp. NPDC051014 TaxID=3155751 RepID=UPI00340EDE49
MTLPPRLHAINEGLAFLIEIAALAVLAWWGWQSVESRALGLLVAVAAPAAAAVLWGMFAAPRARIPVPLPGVLVVKAVVFGAASAALYAMGHVSWAAVAVVVAVANTALATLDRRAAMHRQA